MGERAMGKTMRRAIAVVTFALCVAAIGFDFLGNDEAPASPWIDLALAYLSAAAIGVDAAAAGVRARRGRGPSIKNLSPGGWAIFASMFWLLAGPAYLFARFRRRDGEGDVEPVGVGDGVAVAVVAGLGVGCLLAGAIAAQGSSTQPAVQSVSAVSSALPHAQSAASR